MASAFSTSNMKAEFPNIRTACSQLVEARTRPLQWHVSLRLFIRGNQLQWQVWYGNSKCQIWAWARRS